MPDPPQDDAKKELWSELVKNDIDPDDVFNAMQSGGAYGGLHKETIAPHLEHVLDNVEAHETFWVVAGPTTLPDHHYQFKWSVVEWSESLDGWAASGNSFTEFSPYTNSFASHERVPVDALENWLESRDTTEIFDGIELTDVDLTDLLMLCELFFEQTPATVDSRLKITPDAVGEFYSFVWEVVEWEGTRGEGGEWHARSERPQSDSSGE